MEELKKAIEYFKSNIGETDHGYFEIYNSLFKFICYEANNGSGTNYRIHSNKIERRVFDPLALEAENLNKLVEVIPVI